MISCTCSRWLTRLSCARIASWLGRVARDTARYAKVVWRGSTTTALGLIIVSGLTTITTFTNSLWRCSSWLPRHWRTHSGSSQKWSITDTIMCTIGPIPGCKSRHGSFSRWSWCKWSRHCSSSCHYCTWRACNRKTSATIRPRLSDYRAHSHPRVTCKTGLLTRESSRIAGLSSTRSKRKHRGSKPLSASICVTILTWRGDCWLMKFVRARVTKSNQNNRLNRSANNGKIPTI